MTDDWRLRLAKRRGTARTRKLAMDFQAPLDPLPRPTVCGYPHCDCRLTAGYECPRGLRRPDFINPRNSGNPGET